MLRRVSDTKVHPNTIISTLDGNVRVEDYYLKKYHSPVWSYNYLDHLYELNKISIVKNSSLQKMIKIIFEDKSYVILSPNFPIILDNQIILAKNAKNRKIRSFERDNFGYINHYPSDMLIIDVIPLNEQSETYSLINHLNNNCALIPFSKTNRQNGVIVNI